MNYESPFLLRKTWELVELCADQRRHCRWVNLDEFRNALDSWEIGRKEAYSVLRELEQKNYLASMANVEDHEITEIVITPPTYRCHECRLIVSSRSDWEDHLPNCLRQRAKMERLGLIA